MWRVDGELLRGTKQVEKAGALLKGGSERKQARRARKNLFHGRRIDQSPALWFRKRTCKEGHRTCEEHNMFGCMAC